MQNADIEHTIYGIEALAEEKIIIGEDLLDQLTEYKPIEGVTKIERKIQQEIKFLKKVNRSDSDQLHVSHAEHEWLLCFRCWQPIKWKSITYHAVIWCILIIWCKRCHEPLMYSTWTIQWK